MIECEVRPDLCYLFQYETSQMKCLIEIFAYGWMRSNEMSEANHQEIRAWQKASDLMLPCDPFRWSETFYRHLLKKDILQLG